jgi:hypothetical protein
METGLTQVAACAQCIQAGPSLAVVQSHFAVERDLPFMHVAIEHSMRVGVEAGSAGALNEGEVGGRDASRAWATDCEGCGGPDKPWSLASFRAFAT